MSNFITYINWQVTNYCTGGCSYCHANNWGGPKPRDISEYLKIANKLIAHYSSIGRTINWTFDGGDPLEVFEFPKVLKVCQEADAHITLNTAGGKLWLDWWAWEPYVDFLNLTYHYWQNPSLVRYVIQKFQEKSKPFTVTVPIRAADYFDSDIERAKRLEDELMIPVSKSPLFTDGNSWAGMHNYTDAQLEVLFGPVQAEEKIDDRDKTFIERFDDAATSSPIFTGQLCNVGIEKLNIGAEGWASGSDCNNTPLGNIFQDNFSLPAGPQICKMKSCISANDQTITKFKEITFLKA